MDCKIIRQNENTWIMEDGGVRFFLLKGEERALLVDSGMQIHNARDIASTLTDLPLSLINTHADRDHVGSNHQFESLYMHPAEEEGYRASGGTGRIMPVLEGDVIDLGGRRLTVIELPGHTPGSIALLDESSRVLLSGDPIQRDGRIFMFGPRRDMSAYINSLERLNTMRDRFDWIWPSHAVLPVTPDIIEPLIAGAQAILAGKVKGESVEVHGRYVMACDVGVSIMLCDA